jgi:hypothetical protein
MPRAGGTAEEFGNLGFGEVGGVSEHQHGSLLPGSLASACLTTALIAWRSAMSSVVLSSGGRFPSPAGPPPGPARVDHDATQVGVWLLLSSRVAVELHQAGWTRSSAACQSR